MPTSGTRAIPCLAAKGLAARDDYDLRVYGAPRIGERDRALTADLTALVRGRRPTMRRR